MRVRLTLLTFALAALLSPVEAGAQVLPGWNQKSFTGERIDADRIRLMREVEIEGEPGTPNAGQKFFADDLQMNIKTGELIAVGNVVFATPSARISADSVTFNTKTRLGTFTNASGIAQLGDGAGHLGVERLPRAAGGRGPVRGQRHAHGPCDADGRSAADHHRLDGIHDVRPGGQRHVHDLARQAGLVEHHHRPVTQGDDVLGCEAPLAQVPWSQEARYFCCSSVRASISTPIE